MADKHSLNLDVRELKLGASFTNNKTSQYHTIKYDFKPASVDVNKMATVDVGTNNQVTVTVPHLDGAGVPQTVFKGNQRPYTKECVLIIDRVTGEITLEKLSSNIQVKKTRQESLAKARPLTPVTSDLLTNTTQRSSSRTRVATTRRAPPPPPPPPHQPPHPAHSHNLAGGGPGPAAGPPRGVAGAGAPKQHNMVRSPPRQKTSPPQAAPWSGGGNSTLASLPMIGLDDGPAPPPAPYAQPRHDRVDRPERPERPERAERPERVERPERQERPERAFVPERHPVVAPPVPVSVPVPVPVPVSSQEESSSSSSSESGSDSDSGSDSEDAAPAAPHLPHGHGHGQAPLTNGNASAPALSDVLNDDLCLSESGSDSD